MSESSLCNLISVIIRVLRTDEMFNYVYISSAAHGVQRNINSLTSLIKTAMRTIEPLSE